MGWNREQITRAAKASAAADYAAFEAIGLSEMEEAHVLDVGCFDGFNTFLKFGVYSNVALVQGIDPCEEAVARARETVGDPRFGWTTCALEDYNDEGERYDVVYFSHVLQHLPDKAEALSHVFALLKPGGFVVVKAVDDGAKASWPDPDCLMRQVFELYDQSVRPYVPHTAHTDRYLGMRCGGLLADAGFVDVGTGVRHATTVGMSLQERRDFFERMVYFRRRVPQPEDGGVGNASLQRRMDDLLERWGALFEREDYYFDSPTFVVWGRRPVEKGGEAAPSRSATREGGSVLAGASSGDGLAQDGPCEGGLAESRGENGLWEISPLVEDELADVMAIESRVFPDPWAPVAYAMELRHNPDASYVIAREARDKGGKPVVGYAGWWLQGERAVITRVAVHPRWRRRGLGRAFLDLACKRSFEAGAVSMELTVRASNAGAREFYRALGFSEVARCDSYYARPEDDGIVMVRGLEGRSGGSSCAEQGKGERFQ